MAASEPGSDSEPPLHRSQKVNGAFDSPADARPAGAPTAEQVDGSSSEQRLAQATTEAHANSVDDISSSITRKIPPLLPFRWSPARSHKRQWHGRSPPQPHIPGQTAPFPLHSSLQKKKNYSVLLPHADNEDTKDVESKSEPAKVNKSKDIGREPSNKQVPDPLCIITHGLLAGAVRPGSTHAERKKCGAGTGREEGGEEAQSKPPSAHAWTP